MDFIQIPVGAIQENTYILAKEDLTCVVVDPGNEGDKLINIIKEKQLKPAAILLTHTHYDHIGAVDVIRDEYNIPVYVHKNEQEWLSNPEYNASIKFNGQHVVIRDADHLLDGDQELNIGGFQIQLFETPGHSPGSVSYYFADSGLVCVGDALFHGSIGRTDLYMGSHEQLLNSIHTKLLTLPEETEVLPGHGPTTTISGEMESNPFLNGF
ncbi:MBL fold metallo-hydrolase [Bacillus benzoevorans]|uniref:Glyoxylase-like metal-dependent hydrolase (Beta-lactamase superfamily II) n=1 Tax=Bacillus benzoevorans TaxID=1456 RepID=A0A7X0LVT8_9BACI|nr:MBL fold metallo-hydrolase [Bacillus benzoevorans]MBB6444912.1 glyoxylase-like metal-dependent hydrolase (beta-lactamase superfamily II) [Bacillus benzoevorans]